MRTNIKSIFFLTRQGAKLAHQSKKFQKISFFQLLVIFTYLKLTVIMSVYQNVNLLFPFLETILVYLIIRTRKLFPMISRYYCRMYNFLIYTGLFRFVEKFLFILIRKRERHLSPIYAKSFTSQVAHGAGAYLRFLQC